MVKPWADQEQKLMSIDEPLTRERKNQICHSDRRIIHFQDTKSFGRRKQDSICLIQPMGSQSIKSEQVYLLSSSWFLSAEHIKTLFIERPFTFMTGEDPHLRFTNLWD